jgi:triosephosphate isomerase
MKKLIVANWKMNPLTLDEARRLAASLEHRMHQVSEHTEVVICPPFIFLPALAQYSHILKIGAQNASWQDSGALTGEVSPAQLKQMKIEYVILGHSERRLFLGETDSVVNFKIINALKNKITPVVCLGGEEGAVKEEMKNLVTKQFISVTKDLEKKHLEKIVFAYEPSWAISTMKSSLPAGQVGEPATGEHANELISHIYDLLENRIGKFARNVRVVYGGTVNKDNVQEYARFPQIDGALVGAASLDPENFWQIIKEFNRESIHKN